MNDSSKIWAVVPAAGVGARMAANQPKQYIDIAGKTILEHTLTALLDFPAIQAVQVAVSAEDEYWQDVATNIEDTRLLPKAIGGATRAESVLSGLQRLEQKAADNDWVMVHDAARPCITSKLLEKMLTTLQTSKVGGILAVPVADTLKSVSADLTVQSTVDRSTLWAAQTPQMFRYGLLKKCLQSALQEGAEITDECSAIERKGYQAIIVPSERSNIKVTYPEDVGLVEYYLKG